MELRVVTDAERGQRDGVRPVRAGVPRDREAVLLPLTTRERAGVCAIVEALVLCGECPEDARSVALWQSLCRGFYELTGVQWAEAPW